MTDILSAAKAHFSAQMNGELQSIEVPEWQVDGKPLTIYYKPSMNLRAQEKILQLDNKGKHGEAIAQTLIIRALDKDGKALFKQIDMIEIMRHIDPNIVGNIVKAMMGDDLSLIHI